MPLLTVSQLQILRQEYVNEQNQRFLKILEDIVTELAAKISVEKIRDDILHQVKKNPQKYSISHIIQLKFDKLFNVAKGEEPYEFWYQFPGCNQRRFIMNDEMRRHSAREEFTEYMCREDQTIEKKIFAPLKEAFPEAEILRYMILDPPMMQIEIRFRLDSDIPLKEAERHSHHDDSQA